MGLLQFAAKTYPDHIAISDEQGSVSYRELLRQCAQLAATLQQQYSLQHQCKVGIMCRNHASLIRSIFAVSRTGADVFLISTDISRQQFQKLADKHHFHLVIYDDDLQPYIEASAAHLPALAADRHAAPSIRHYAAHRTTTLQRMRRASFGKITVLTSGTTGGFKVAERRSSLLSILDPFTDILNKLDPGTFRSVYIATPVYHGFGLAASFMCVAMGATMVLRRKFDVATACDLLTSKQADVLIAVPLMLQRMNDEQHGVLKIPACIVSGGAALRQELTEDLVQKQGARLYNLYGTSEAGVCIMATPEDLKRYPGSIGRELKGVHMVILNDNGKEAAIGATGSMCISSMWMANDTVYVETGDLACKNEEGYIFLHGRKDDMIVSGGENVYPAELEHLLIQHPLIADAAVTGIADAAYGERLKAYVVAKTGCQLTDTDLREWLRPRVARYQVPAQIAYVAALPYNALGKVDKKTLGSGTYV